MSSIVTQLNKEPGRDSETGINIGASVSRPGQDVLSVYYGIQDALRYLGDPDHDAGDGPELPIEYVISGLWDAASAFSRLLEQAAKDA